ncbi:MAG: stage II sporulation protein M [Gammaproteobacteria bacterium]
MIEADNDIEQRALASWLQQRIAAWQELESLLQSRDKKSHDIAQARSIISGFRTLVSDLSLARTTIPGSRIHQWLETLFLRGHQLIYRAPGNTLLRWRDIFAFESPALIRQMANLLLSTIALFISSILCGWLLIRAYPDLTPLFASAEMINRVQAGELWTDGLLNIMPSSLLSLSLMTNNITVSIFAFSLGAFYGLGTLYIISLNGLMLGGVFAFTGQHGLDDELFEFVIAHGVVELSVICIAGAMGLKLGEALLRPGSMTRQQAFRKATTDAGKVLLVALPFLVLAGLIEGYISPDPQFSLSFRIAVGGISGTLFWLLLVFGLPWLRH